MENETTYDFISPPVWEVGLDDLAERHRKLAAVEQEIDEEVYRLYGISDEDRAAIEEELAEPTEPTKRATRKVKISGSDLLKMPKQGRRGTAHPRERARRISNAVGIVMGRFEPGIDRLGRGTSPRPYSEAPGTRPLQWHPRPRSGPPRRSARQRPPGSAAYVRPKCYKSRLPPRGLAGAAIRKTNCAAISNAAFFKDLLGKAEVPQAPRLLAAPVAGGKRTVYGSSTKS